MRRPQIIRHEIRIIELGHGLVWMHLPGQQHLPAEPFDVLFLLLGCVRPGEGVVDQRCRISIPAFQPPADQPQQSMCIWVERMAKS